MKRKNGNHRDESGSMVGHARRVAASTGVALNGAPYAAGSIGLMIALAKWIVEHSNRPVLDGQVYGGILETLVEAMATRESHDVAA